MLFATNKPVRAIIDEELAVPSTQSDRLVEIPESAAGCKAMVQVLDRVGDKWTIMVVATLSHGAMRFNALQRAVPGISHRMLTLTLRGLERDGLVSRQAFATIPPRVDYALTELGTSLTEPLRALRSWAIAREPEITVARARYDALLPDHSPSSTSL